MKAEKIEMSCDICGKNLDADLEGVTHDRDLNPVSDQDGFSSIFFTAGKIRGSIPDVEARIDICWICSPANSGSPAKNTVAAVFKFMKHNLGGKS